MVPKCVGRVASSSCATGGRRSSSRPSTRRHAHGCGWGQSHGGTGRLPWRESRSLSVTHETLETEEVEQGSSAVAGGFKINKQAIKKMTRELEKEFAKNPVKVPLEADSGGVAFPSSPSITNNYHGPIVTVNGDNA